MPELPEVETVRTSLERLLTGRRILKVDLRLEKLLRKADPKAFVTGLRGRTVIKVERRAKYLLVRLDRGTLLVHLGMTGQVLAQCQGRVASAEFTLPDKHTHLVLELTDGFQLFFRDPRRFGRLGLITPEQEHTLFQRLGPEPLGPGFTAQGLARVLAGRKASIKSLLLNQRVVAGVGNIYADESLFRAGISPRKPGGRLSPGARQALHASIRSVLKQAIRAGGTSISDFCDTDYHPGEFQFQLRVYGREGEPCRQCGRPIRKAVVAQRGTHWCSHCQPA